MASSSMAPASAHFKINKLDQLHPGARKVVDELKLGDYEPHYYKMSISGHVKEDAVLELHLTELEKDGGLKLTYRIKDLEGKEVKNMQNMEWVFSNRNLISHQRLSIGSMPVIIPDASAPPAQNKMILDTTMNMLFPMMINPKELTPIQPGFRLEKR